MPRCGARRPSTYRSVVETSSPRILAERTAVVGCSAVAIIAATDARYAAPLAPLIT